MSGVIPVIPRKSFDILALYKSDYYYYYYDIHISYASYTGSKFPFMRIKLTVIPVIDVISRSLSHYCRHVVCGELSFTGFCLFVGHAVNEINYVWQQISRTQLVRMGGNLAF